MTNPKINKGKGEYGKYCNRTACQAPFAFYFNHSTRKYYCIECAKMINKANYHDSMRLFGHELCEFVAPENVNKLM